jgi:hypothetical protein
MKNRFERCQDLALANCLFLSASQVLDLPHSLGKFIGAGDEGQLEAAFLGELELGPDFFGFRKNFNADAGRT